VSDLKSAVKNQSSLFPKMQSQPWWTCNCHFS